MSEYRVVTDHTEDGFRFVSAVCGGFVFQVEAVRQPKIVAAELGGDWLVTVTAPWLAESSASPGGAASMASSAGMPAVSASAPNCSSSSHPASCPMAMSMIRASGCSASIWAKELGAKLVVVTW